MKTIWAKPGPKKFVTHEELPALMRRAIADMILGVSINVACGAVDAAQSTRVGGSENVSDDEKKGNGKGRWSRPPVIAGKQHDHKQRCGKDCSARRP